MERVFVYQKERKNERKKKDGEKKMVLNKEITMKVRKETKNLFFNVIDYRWS